MNIAKVVEAVASVLPERRPIGHHEPCINGKESAYVTECLSGGIVGDAWVKKFESKLAAYCDVENVIGVSSGTAALHVGLLAGGVLPGDEVLVPTLTFAATANAVTYVGAVPHFIDGSVGLSTFKFRQYMAANTEPAERGRHNPKTGRTISAIIIVDLLGFPADNIRLIELAESYRLTAIEDASQALGASLGNKRCGSFGALATLSFNNNKIVTTNGGGAVLTNDPWIAAKAMQLATTAREPHPFHIKHDCIGYNYRLNNINAAMGLAQLEQIEDFLRVKKELHEKYKAALSECEDVSILEYGLQYSVPNYWLTTLMIGPKAMNQRDELLEALHKAGIKARALFQPLHTLPHFADCPRSDMGYADYTFKRAVCLPSGAGLCGS